MPWVWPQSWARSVDHRSGRCNCTGRRAAAREVHRSTRARETVLFDGGVVVQISVPGSKRRATGRAMLDLIIRGGDVVTPQGVTRCDVGVKGETIAAVTAAGALPDTNAQRIIDAAGKIVMPGGIDPHVHMAHPFMIPDGTILYTQGHRSGRTGGVVGRHHHAHRLQPTYGRQERAGGRSRRGWRNSRADCSVRLGLPPCCRATRRIRSAAAARRGDPGRAPHGEDLHHQHHPEPHRAHGRFRRHLGGVPGAGQGGRPRRHPRRGQRHRHAHVRQADPRGPRRLREHGGGAQHPLRGPVLPPRDAARGAGARHRALHDARLGGDGRGGDPRGARQDLPIYGESLHQYMLYTDEDYRRPNGQMYHTYPSLKSQADQDELWRGTLDGSINCVATDELCCSLARRRRASASTTPPAAIPASSRASASCTPRWWASAAIR